MKHRKFFFEIVGFGLVLFLSLNLVATFLLRANLLGSAVENSFIYSSIEKSRKNWEQGEVFVFGDSVAHQMYSPKLYAERIVSLTMVMPTTMGGQYLLMNRLANATNLYGKRVVLIIIPESLTRDLAHDQTFHYLLKPFYNNEFIELDSDLFKLNISSPLVASLSQIPVIRSSNWIPPKRFKYLTNGIGRVEGLSPLSVLYLNKMQDLADDIGFSLEILPAVQPESASVIDFKLLKDQLQDSGLLDMFESYFENMSYLPDKHFRDGAHLYNESVLGTNFLGL